MKAVPLDQILACFDKEKIREIGLKTKFSQRKRKIGAFEFLVALTVAASGKSKPSLESYISAIQVPVSREALGSRMNQAAVQFMRESLKFVAANKSESGEKRIDGLDNFRAVKLFDSTMIPVSKDLLDKYKGRGGLARCKLQVCYEITKGNLDLCAITSGLVPDQKYAEECPAFIEKGDLALMDLGYFSARLFEAISKKEAFFLTKFNWQTNAFDPKTKKLIDIKKLATKLTVGSVQTIDICLSNRSVKEVRCRLIFAKLPQNISDKKRRNLQKTARSHGKQPSADSLFWCDWILLVTNVPEVMVPARVLLECYAVRWQIELLFKIFKSVLKLDQMNPVGQNRLFCEIYGRVILGIILLRIHASIAGPSWNSHHRTISLIKFSKHFADNTQELTHKLMLNFTAACRWLNRQLPFWAKGSISPPQRTRPSTFEKIAISFNGNEYHS